MYSWCKQNLCVLPMAAFLGFSALAMPAMAAPVDGSVDFRANQAANMEVDMNASDEMIRDNSYKPIDENYIMRTGDVFTCVVLYNNEVSRQGGASGPMYTMRTDGCITMPLIGRVRCAGRTIYDVENEVRERYAKFIRNPDVTINIHEMGTTRVYVLGEINRQGLYEISKSHRLMDALAAANGFTEYSAKKKIFVIRRGSQEASYKVNFNKLLKTGDPSVNVELFEGDCVYLTSNEKFVFANDITPWLTATNNVVDTRYKVKNF